MIMIYRNKHPKRSSTLYNVISSLVENAESVNDKIEKGIPLIFDFDYIPAAYSSKPWINDFKTGFEKAFVMKYLERYFSCTTYELFKFKLQSKLWAVMPEYLSKAEILFDQSQDFLTDVTTSESKNKNINSDLPIGIINADNLGGVKYGQNGGLTESSNITKNKNLVEKKIKYNEAVAGVLNSLLDEFQDLFSFLL